MSEDTEIEYIVTLRRLTFSSGHGYVKASSIEEAVEKANRGKWSDDIEIDGAELLDWTVVDAEENE